MASFLSSAAYAAAVADTRPAIAVVTGGKSGIGLALAQRIASFPFIETVLTVSRSISPSDVKAYDPKITALCADVSTVSGRQSIVSHVRRLCDDNNGERKKQLRFLIHSAGTIDPIKPVWDVEPEELRNAMSINCEASFFLTTALYPFMQSPPLQERQPEDGESDKSGGNSSSTSMIAGRVLHVSSGAAHGAPPAGWGVYGITKAALFQTFRVLEREFRETGGAKVVVGSFKPGVVDTSMQGTIRNATDSLMPAVKVFRGMKDKTATTVPVSNSAAAAAAASARPPPKGALDSPSNVAFFAEYLLMGTTDEEFANAKDDNEYDIRNAELFERWISPENLP